MDESVERLELIRRRRRRCCSLVDCLFAPRTESGPSQRASVSPLQAGLSECGLENWWQILRFYSLMLGDRTFRRNQGREGERL